MRQQAPARSPLTTIWFMVRFWFGEGVDTLRGEEVVDFALNHVLGLMFACSSNLEVR